jgi:S-layer protein (TIGR01567 family)
MTTFIMKPESEVIIDTPQERESKWKLICGKIRANVKRMMKDGTMEVPMSQAVAGIKGTTIVCEETGRSSSLKVLEGSASFKSKATNEEILLNAGEMATATPSGLSAPESFDVEAENESWMEHIAETEVPAAEESTVIYNSWNPDTVDNAPTCSPLFTIGEPQMITYIDSYHWNYGQGAPAGTIGLRDGYGTIFGPWQAETSHDGGEVPKGYWIAHPNEVIQAGTYTIEDSDPDTWSKNSESPCGLARVEGYAVEPSAFRESAVVATDTKETSSAKGTSSRPPAAGTADAGAAGSQERGSMAKEKSDAVTNSHATDSATSDSGKADLAASKPEQSSIEEISYPTATDRSTEIRGPVATGDFECTAQNFAGFYYDPDNDVGTEALTATLRDGWLSGSQPFGLQYQTIAQLQDFAFQDWGSYKAMGFLGEKYFAGYVESDSEYGYLFDHSGDKSALARGQLLKILADDDTETTITTDTHLQLEDGYKLSIKSIDIDGNVVDLELSRNGNTVDSAEVSPSKDGATIADQTYLYKKDIGELKDLVVIAVHFKNAFRGADQDLATVDGQWQLSEKPVYVTEGSQFGKMTVQSVNDDAISMANQGEGITLSRNKDLSIMPGMGIKTADADELRYYIYREITDPGIHEIRSTVDTADYAAWTAAEFAGFYYNLDKDIGTEMLAAEITDGKLAQPDGIRYTTQAAAADFKFEDWGSYDLIGFIGEKCFAGYIDGSDSGKGYLFEKSSNKSALAKGQLLKVLVNDDEEQTITSNTPLMLAEGYRLELKSVNPDDGRTFVELRKGDQLVDNDIVQPSKDDATLSDKTYFYRDPSLGLVTIAVHFKNAFKGADQNLATIDGIWHISDSPIAVSRGTCFDKLTVSDVTDRSIVMNNIDQTITLSRDKRVSLAGDILIRTADSDSLRYYIVKEVSI